MNNIIRVFKIFSDINECDSAPCKNGGTCADIINGFTCSWPDGYYGDICEIG